MDFDYTNETITPDTTGSINIGGTGAFGVPIGTTSQAITPSAGLIRYDSTINQLTWSNASNWTTLSTGNTFKVSTLAATTADLAAASNTASTITGTLVVFPAQDGITLALNNRLLVKNQTAPAQNGIYTVTTVGVAATTAWVLTRSIDADVIAELASAIVSVDSGTLNGGLVYCNNTKTTDTLGTTAVTWSRNVDLGYLPTYLLSPGAIGTTTPAAGAFTTLSAKGTTATDGPTLGTELITGGTWTSTGWTGDNTTGWVNGVSNVTPLSYSLAAVISTRYQVTYTVTRTSGSVNVTFGGQSYTGISATGSFGPTATTTGNLIITPTVDFVGSIIISVKSITAISSALVSMLDSSSTLRYEERISSAGNNTFLGLSSGRYTTTGVSNTGVGVSSLLNVTTGFQNSALGVSALSANTVGYNNSAVGVSSLQSNVSGVNNSAVGSHSLVANTTGSSNTSVGSSSSQNNTTGANNVAVGTSALQNNVTGGSNTAVGTNSLFSNTASNNVGVGYYALGLNTSGTNNSALGFNSLYYNVSGSFNSAFGYQSLYSNTVNANTAFGYYTLKSNTIGTANTAVGTQSLYSNTTILTSLGTVTGGTGYTNGTYTDVPLTYVSGNGVTPGVGSYPTATIVVSGGVVATVTLTTYGSCFKDSTTVFSCAAASVGGTGTGFSVPSNTLATGTNNTAVGYQSLYSNIIGIQNLALGLNTLRSNTFGSNNVSLGVSSLNYNTTGNGNTANGTFALQNNITGSNNVALGQNSATYIADGVTALTVVNNSTYLGTNTKASANNVTNETVIGYNITGSGSDTTTIGGSTLLASPPLSTAVNNEVVTASWVINKYGTIVLNDISTQFDGSKNVFDLLQDQTTINSVVDSKDLDVTINGMRLSPYVDKYTYPWLTPFDSFNGFRVINIPNNTTGLTTVGKIIIYNAPYIGDYGSCILRQISTTRQKQKYPFTATTIALGD